MFATFFTRPIHLNPRLSVSFSSIPRSFFGIIIFCVIVIAAPSKSFAWGPEGHAIVGRLAMRFVTDDVRKNVIKILGQMPVDTAANWMDIVKSNSDYDFMRSWHYLDFAKGKEYQVSNDDNIINRLILTYNELLHKKVLCDLQVQTDLYILLHLMGDLHMPLHTGYEDDLGGNKVIVQYDSIKTHNLHRFWDEDIITLTKITDEDCIALYKSSSKDSLEAIDFVSWMKESRSLLPRVYNFDDFRLSRQYLNENSQIVKQQLLKAGLRLATILNALFESSAPSIDYLLAAKKYKNSIAVEDAVNHVGENVTICAAVTNIKVSKALAQVTLQNPVTNSKLTMVIFARNFESFTPSITNFLKNKNVCVKGKIELFNNKPQIIIEKKEDVILE